MGGVTAQDVKKLRDETSAGMLDCKKALAEADGDFEKAKEVLRKKGVAAVAKRSDREAGEGYISSYVHHGGKVGVLVEVRCETDFVARTDEFQKIGKTVAMQVAVSNPSYLSKEEVPEDILEKERKFVSEEASGSGKPENIVEKIVTGRIEKFYKEICLLEQEFLISSESEAKTVNDFVNESAAKLGEKIEVTGFRRMELG
ncbi:MAG: translation elongation factor Ts [Candidatus Lindowbacteria bacterium]|nr:translation elongation factor Ts [Candidatus Lindowbacteria bacterium]